MSKALKITIVVALLAVVAYLVYKYYTKTKPTVFVNQRTGSALGPTPVVITKIDPVTGLGTQHYTTSNEVDYDTAGLDSQRNGGSRAGG